MTPTGSIRFATYLCTFYNPAYWGHEGGYASIGELFTWGQWNELTFWNRVLDDVRDAGLDGIEITFAPGDWTSALTAYGSAQGFAREVANRGLDVCSGFFSSRVPGTEPHLDLASQDDRSEYIELADRYAEFLAAVGAPVMITALGLRRHKLAEPPLRRILSRPPVAIVGRALLRFRMENATGFLPGIRWRPFAPRLV